MSLDHPDHTDADIVQEEGQEEMEENEKEPSEVTIRLEVCIRDQEALDRLIQQGLFAFVLKPKSGGDAVSYLADLKEGALYVPGPERVASTSKVKRRRSSNTWTRYPNKQRRSDPSFVRGAIVERHNEQMRRSYENSTRGSSSSSYHTPLAHRSSSSAFAFSMDPSNMKARIARRDAKYAKVLDKLDRAKAEAAVSFDKAQQAEDALQQAQAANEELKAAVGRAEAETLRLIFLEHVSEQDSTEGSTGPRTVSFKEHDGTYHPDFEALMMANLMDTSFSKAWAVTKRNYEIMAGLRADIKTVCTDCPSLSWMQKCLKRADVLCDLQIALCLLNHANWDIVAAHDGTTVFGHHMQGFQLMLGDRTFSLGIDEVEDGTAVVSFASFMRRVTEILETMQSQGINVDADVEKVLLKISSSLSDRCAVELKWAQLLEDKKFDVIQERYSALSEERQRQLAKVYKFFCMAHALSGMTEQLEVLFKARRKETQERIVYKRTAFHAVYETCKTFNPTSKWGFQLFQMYRDYCQDNEIRGHAFLSGVGRCVGSRNHNQLLPAAQMYVLALYHCWSRFYWPFTSYV